MSFDSKAFDGYAPAGTRCGFDAARERFREMGHSVFGGSEVVG